MTNFLSQSTTKQAKISILKNPEFQAFLKVLVTDDDVEYFDYWKQQIIENKYTEKQLSRSFLRDAIVYRIETGLVELARRYRPIFKKYSRLFSKPVPVEIDNDFIAVMAMALDRIYEPVLVLNANVMDAYMLARIFKFFRTTANGPLSQPNKPRNILIYSGVGHSERYAFVLGLLGFKTLSSYNPPIKTRKHENCLDMSELSPPFLSTPRNITDNDGYFY